MLPHFTDEYAKVSGILFMFLKIIKPESGKAKSQSLGCLTPEHRGLPQAHRLTGFLTSGTAILFPVSISYYLDLMAVPFLVEDFLDNGHSQ